MVAVVVDEVDGGGGGGGGGRDRGGGGGWRAGGGRGVAGAAGRAARRPAARAARRAAGGPRHLGRAPALDHALRLRRVGLAADVPVVVEQREDGRGEVVAAVDGEVDAVAGAHRDALLA